VNTPTDPTGGGPIPLLGQPRSLPQGARARLTLPSGVAVNGPAELLIPLQTMIDGLVELQRATLALAGQVRALELRVGQLAEQLGRGPR
jgi:hypothetical protein